MTGSGEIEADVQTVLRYAKGEQEHRFRGSCPDAAMGEKGYDLACLVCQAILRLDARASDSGSNEADS